MSEQIVRYLVVNRDNEPQGSVTRVPPSDVYLETMNSPGMGSYILQGQPYRVVRLVEDLTYNTEGHHGEEARNEH